MKRRSFFGVVAGGLCSLLGVKTHGDSVTLDTHLTDPGQWFVAARRLDWSRDCPLDSRMFDHPGWVLPAVQFAVIDQFPGETHDWFRVTRSTSKTKAMDAMMNFQTDEFDKWINEKP